MKKMVLLVALLTLVLAVPCFAQSGFTSLKAGSLAVSGVSSGSRAAFCGISGSLAGNTSWASGGASFDGYNGRSFFGTSNGADIDTRANSGSIGGTLTGAKGFAEAGAEQGGIGIAYGSGFHMGFGGNGIGN